MTNKNGSNENGDSQVVLVEKNPLAKVIGRGSIPGSGRSPGGGHGKALHYSCLENPMGRGAGVAKTPWGREESDMTEAS